CVVLLEACEEIGLRWAALNPMIGHHDMDYILRAPIGHMTFWAVDCGWLRMPTLGNLAVTGQTALTKLLNPFSSTWCSMRIMAGRTGQFSAASLKTLGLAKPKGRAIDLEFVVMPGLGRMIEMNQIIFEILSRAERIDPPPKSTHRLW